MKTLRKTEQKNVLLCKDCYTIGELRSLAENGIITVFSNKPFEPLELNNLDFMYESNSPFENYTLRVFLGDTKEIKVIYNKNFGHYENVVILNNGIELKIEL